MPIINFLDRKSLLSWLEVRKMVLEVGARFQTRIQYYSSFHLVLFLVMAGFLFATASGLGLSFSVLNIEQWVSFSILFVYLGTFVFMFLMPNAYLNQEMEWQIKRLLKVKTVYQRIIRDDGMLKANPITINNRIQQLALMLLRH